MTALATIRQDISSLTLSLPSLCKVSFLCQSEQGNHGRFAEKGTAPWLIASTGHWLKISAKNLLPCKCSSNSLWAKNTRSLEPASVTPDLSTVRNNSKPRLTLECRMMSFVFHFTRWTSTHVCNITTRAIFQWYTSADELSMNARGIVSKSNLIDYVMHKENKIAQSHDWFMLIRNFRKV